MVQVHEDWGALPNKVRDIHRALRSVIEELEAIDWYHQRAAATEDPSLRAVIEHNRDEEIEHATMALEWLRRNMPVWDEALRTYLFTTAPVTEVEALVEASAGGVGEHKGGGLEAGERREPSAAAAGERVARRDLGIGKLES